jgi:uncharacterized protein (DUF433 family)
VRAGKIPGKREIRRIFEEARSGRRDVYMDSLVIKPRLTRGEATYWIRQGKSIDELESGYNGLTRGQLIACKATITREQKRLRDGLTGADVVRMLDGGVPKEELMRTYGFTDYEIRGYRAAARRGAYKSPLPAN